MNFYSALHNFKSLEQAADQHSFPELDQLKKNKKGSRAFLPVLKTEISAIEFLLALSRAWVKILNWQQKYGHKNPNTHQSNSQEFLQSREEYFQAINIWQKAPCLIQDTQAIQHWEIFMQLLATECQNPIEMGCRCCGKVSRHETLLLQSAYYIQVQDYQKALNVCQYLIKPDYSDLALHYMILTINSLTEKNMHINPAVITALLQPEYQQKLQ